MRNPRAHILFLTTLLVVGGLMVRVWLPPAANLAGLNHKTVAVRTVALISAPLAKATASVTPADAPVSADNIAAMHPQQLSAEDNLLVAEMCDLQLMAQGTDLALDSSQWSALAAVVLRTEAVRHAFEAQIATSKVIAPGRYRLEIPAYATAGDVLREQFAVELCAQLGEPVAMDVIAKLGDRLEGRFAGFGVGVQTLDIVAPPGGEPNDVQVMQTATYWNSVEGGDRVTTRREIHFPGLEDPTGDTWGALLAMVNAAGAANGPG